MDLGIDMVKCRYFTFYYKLGDYVIDTVPNRNKLDEYLIENIRQSFRYLVGQSWKRRVHGSRVCNVISCSCMSAE